MIQLCKRKHVNEIPGLQQDYSRTTAGLTLGSGGSSCVVLLPVLPVAGVVVALLDPLGLKRLHPLLRTPAPGWWGTLRPFVRVFIFPDAVAHVLPLRLASLRAETPVVSPLQGVDVMVVSITQGELPIGQTSLH